MTTIAANRKLIVSDSKVSIENKGISYPAVKLCKGPGLVAGAAGDGGDCTRFLKWASGGFKGAEPKWLDVGTEDSMIGLVVKADGIYIFTHGDPEPERIEADSFAVGSGGKAARAAMLMGADPVEAVKIAIAIDDFSGLPLQILELE